MKLNKAQREFFSTMARESVKGLLLAVAHQRGLRVERLDEALNVVNVDKLTEVYAEHMLSKVDFKAIQKVDRFTRSKDYQEVMAAAGDISDSVNAELANVLSPFLAMLPSEEEATEENA